MTKLYVGISAVIFALVAIGHIARLVLGWEVQVGGTGIAMSVSGAALIASALLAVWGGILLRR
jgi:hypothetical protein